MWFSARSVKTTEYSSRPSGSISGRRLGMEVPPQEVTALRDTGHRRCRAGGTVTGIREAFLGRTAAGTRLSAPRACCPRASALRRARLDYRRAGVTLRTTIKELPEDAMTEADELEKLGDLHSRGILSDDEFSRAKARVLSGSAAPQGLAPAVHAINGLRRSRDDRWLGGVCGGIGRSTGIAAWLWRLVFTFLALCAGTGVLAYLLMWIFVPLEPARSGVGQAAG
jgi:phage shock protein C